MAVTSALAAMTLLVFIPVLAAGAPERPAGFRDVPERMAGQPAQKPNMAPDRNPSARPAAAIISVQLDAVTDSAADGSIAVNGDRITYTVRVKNVSASLQNIRFVEDILPPVALVNVTCLAGPACTPRLVTATATVPGDRPGLEVTFPITTTAAVTWGAIALTPGQEEILKFAATIDCQPGGAILRNEVEVTFGSGSSATSNEAATTIQFDRNEVNANANGRSFLLGPNGCSFEVAGYEQDWGDFDRDGDLDLAMANFEKTAVYRNDGGRLTPLEVFQQRRTFSVRWANLDNDPNLELIAVGQELTTTIPRQGQNYIYDYSPVTGFAETVFLTPDVLWKIALEYNQAGQLKMAAAGYIGPVQNEYNLCRLRIYDYNPASPRKFIPGNCLISPLTNRTSWQSDSRDTYSLAWSDVDRDGDLDLTEGNNGYFNRWYVNSGRNLLSNTTFLIDAGNVTLSDATRSIAWGDYDRDGDLDLAWGNDGQPNRLLERASPLSPVSWQASAWTDPNSDRTQSVAWAIPDTADASLPMQDDGSIEYLLPFTTPFRFGNPARDIVKIVVNTNGGVELLEAGETPCFACQFYFNTHTSSIYRDQNIDAIFGFSTDLYSGVIIEGNQERVEITWMGTTYTDRSSFLSNSVLFKVIMQRDGRIEWKFFSMNQATAWPGTDFFAGIYDEQADQDYPDADGLLNTSLTFGTVPPQSQVQQTAYRFHPPLASGNFSGPVWGPFDGRIPVADNAVITQSLPFAFPFFTQTIASVAINSNGLVELLTATESCQECALPNTHFNNAHVAKQIDAIFAANDDLKTGVFVEYLTNTVGITADELSIIWMGTTNMDDSIGFGTGFRSRPLAYKVALFSNGAVEWKFFDMNYQLISGDLFSGLYRTPGAESEVLGGSTTFRGNGVNRQFRFEPGLVTPPAAIPLSGQDLQLAVGNLAGRNYVYSVQGGAVLTLTWSSNDIEDTYSVAWGDYDGDGDLDLATGNYNRPNRVYRSNGLLPPDATWSSTEQESTRSVAWADWDGDNDLDLAVGNEGQPNHIYETDQHDGYKLKLDPANGFGWSSPETDPTWSVAWGDIDGDSDPDLAVGNNNGPSRLYLNEGGGVMTLIWSSVETAETRAVAWGDVDQDGDLDLAVGNNGPNYLYLNQLKFKPNPTEEIRSLGTIRDITWGDYNNDGEPDLAVSGFDLQAPGGGFIYVLDTVTDQTISIEPGAAAVNSEPTDLDWADYNRDGYLDLAAAFPTIRRVRLYRNPGSSAAPWSLQPEITAEAFALDWADFQRDGWPDLIVADSPQSGVPQIKIFLNNNGSVATASSIDRRIDQTSNISGQLRSIQAIDRDNDGDLDVSTLNLKGQGRLFTAFGAFLNTKIRPVANSQASSVAWGDYDADGWLDLLFGGSPGGTASRLYRSQQGLSFAADLVFASGGRRDVAFGDVNGDGRLDVADGGPGGDVAIFLNGGSTWNNNNVDAHTVTFGDADGDGRLDLLVGGSQDNPSQNPLFINTGAAPYFGSTPNWQTPQAENSLSIAWADYDSDNHLDFAVGNCKPGVITDNVRLYRNLGNSTFQAVTGSGLPQNSACTTSLAWVDYDGDQDPDLAIGNAGSPNYIYANNQGVFSKVWDSADTSQTTSVAWGDWNNDGTPDLAIGNYGQPDRVYANFSTPTAPALVWLWQSQESFQTTDLAWGDADGDGDLDLAISQDGSGSNGFYENGLSLPAHLQTGNFPTLMPLLANPTYLRLKRPGASDAYLISAPAITTPVIKIDYTLFDPDGTRDPSVSNSQGDPIVPSQTRYEYSVNGGNSWQTAILSGTSTQTGLTSRQGQTATVYWDAAANAVVSDDVRFRITIVSQEAAGQTQRVTSRAVSPPFRVRSGLSCAWPANAQITSKIGDVVTNTVAAGQVIQFEASFDLLGPGSTVLTHTWQFGDGITGTGIVQVSHIYTRPNQVYTVTLAIVGEPCPEVRQAVATAVITVGNPLLLPTTLYFPVIVKPTITGATQLTGLPATSKPARVTGLRGSDLPDGVRLEWSLNPPADAVAGYAIYRRPRGGSGAFEWLSTAPAESATFTDTSASCGVMYYLTAFNSAGESPPSSAIYVSRACR